MRPEVAHARKQRKAMSYPEVLLWQRLRSKNSGLHFRKQHPIGPYTADFYYAPKRLVIEVDGQIHATPTAIAHDGERDSFLTLNRYNVVRVLAADVLKDADAAATSIVALAERPLHHAASRRGPPPRAGEDLGS
jgi:very-short-patch-repair endonuclease